jgi:PAS domain S-box-containing protein
MKTRSSANEKPRSEPVRPTGPEPRGRAQAERSETAGEGRRPGAGARFWPVAVAVAYMLAGTLWILLSDYLLEMVVADARTARNLETYKDALFFVVTAVLLFWGLSRYLGRMRGAESRLRESEARFRLLVAGVKDYAIILLDTQGRVSSWNSGAHRITGYREEEILGQHFSCFYLPEDIEGGQPGRALQGAIRHGRFEEEARRVRKGGREFAAEVHITALYDPSDTLCGFGAIMRDISERKRAEDERARADKAMRAMSQCGQAVIRARTEEELLQEVCRVIVKEADYRFAWVGFVEQDEAKTVRPVAQAGYEEGYLQTVRVTWADTERGRGPVGMSIRTGQHFVVQNVATEPFFAPWRAEAARRGYSSLISLPLLREERAFGALAIYAAEAEAFDEHAVGLLNDLANDLAAGLAALRGRAEQRRAEQVLRQSDNTMRALFNAITEPLFLMDPHGTILTANEAVAQRHGRPVEQLLGTEAFALLPPALAESRRQRMGEVLRLKKPVAFEDSHQGSWFDNTAYPIFDERGSVAQVVFLSRDITEQRWAVEALRASESRFRSLVEQSLTGVYVIQNDSFAYVNPQFAEIFGYSRDELLSRLPVLSAVHEPDRALVARNLRERLTGQAQTIRYAFRGRRKDGRVIEVEVHGTRIDWNGQAAILGTLVEITERKQAEEALKQHKERLQVLSRHLVDVQEAERRHLARELHDEIGQGLTAFKISLQTLPPTADSGGRQKQVEESIRLIDGLLDQVRNLSLNLRPPLLDDLGLSPALRWLVNEDCQRAGLQPQLRMDPALPRFEPALETACFRIIQEALTNVARHAAARRVTVEVACENDLVHLKVQDDGKGFDYAAARQRAAEGTSLGLLAMEERAALAAGHFTLSSQPGQGTVVEAWLPVRWPASDQTAWNAG